MKRLIPILAWGLIAIFSGVAGVRAAHAQEQGEIASCRGPSPHQISLGAGQSVVCDLPQDAAEIFVADPSIANALVRSPHKLYLIGVKGGQTTVFALDHMGRKIASYELSINTPSVFVIDIGGLQRMLRTVMPGAAIKARLANNQYIILTGTVDSPEEAKQALDIAKAFRSPAAVPGSQSTTSANGAASQTTNVSTPIVNITPANQSQAEDTSGIINLITIRGRAQVMLKVTVAEVGREVAKQLGITTSSLVANWGTFTQFNPFPIQGVIAPASVAAPGYPLDATTTALRAHNPDNSLSATLQAFERYGVTRILAEPTVSAVSGESAKLTVGGEIPIPSVPSCSAVGTGAASTTNCTGGTTYQPYGVTLNFTPSVLAEGRIELHLATEVSELDPAHGATIFGAFVPGLLTRRNATTVEIPSGGSIASAGLLETRSHQAFNGLPGLLDLPVLGTLFRSRDYQRDETELMIIVTPYIVKPVQANQIAKPTDGFADASDPQAWLLGRINKLYASPGNQEAIQDYKGPVGFIQD